MTTSAMAGSFSSLTPGDFATVCTTELSKMAQYIPEFEKRGVKLLGLSCDDVQSHNEKDSCIMMDDCNY
ncbi:hypothetical protein Patl1_03285 [Pistacia atlantica]|uniref:Uncharacterized protein n=1 Tax=Pistacia atlantica TaxID=434234 RepID=A0ACC1C421_9ROSI|nr:hypothetical protein Patl1_03285 [Pistacia atlantica]